MNGASRWPTRLAHRWVEFYTRNAPQVDAQCRRDEVASDVFEQVAAARADGESDRCSGWAVAGRALRGVPADLAWRVEVEQSPGRLAWHVAHPATVLTLALLALVPLSVTADLLRGGEDEWRAAGLVGLADVLASALVVAFALVALVRGHRGEDPAQPWTARRARRAMVCTMSFCWALSGVWRFNVQPLGVVAALAWLGFGLSLMAYLVVVVAGGAGRLRRSDRSRGLTFRKVPS